MRAHEFLSEEFNELRPTTIPLSDYRGEMDERTPDEKDLTVLWNLVDNYLDTKGMPPIIRLNPKRLLATQTWLSDWGSDEDVWPELTKYPVVVQHEGQLLIVDGHHRVANALSKNALAISVYMVKV